MDIDYGKTFTLDRPFFNDSSFRGGEFSLLQIPIQSFSIYYIKQWESHWFIGTKYTHQIVVRKYNIGLYTQSFPLK